MYSEPSKASKIELFTNIVDCIQLLTIFAKHSILGVSQVRYASGKKKRKKKNLVRCHLIHKKSGLQSLQISSTFKFNFIFTLLPYGETLLIANSIHVSLISH